MMRDPEMIFETEGSGEQMNLVPYYRRNDYAGIEQYFAFVEVGRTLLNAQLSVNTLPLLIFGTPI